MRSNRLPLVVAAVAATVLPVLPAAALPTPPQLPQPPGLPETAVPYFQECAQNLAFPGPSGEIYGPTDVNATSANGRMAAAFNRQGTITVLRYPRPSYYDQVKYRTSTRDEERFGALENEGVFLGLLVPGEGTTWLRDLPSTQRYLDGRSDSVQVTHDAAGLGLEVVVTDTVTAGDRDLDALVRTVDVTVTDPSAVPTEGVEVVAFENLNLTVKRVPYLPLMDWCADELNTDTATYDPDVDALVHSVTGLDQASLTTESVAMAVGFDRASSQHQVGGDAFEGTALPAGQPPLPTQDAYLDAADGVLSGNADYTGQTTGALTTALDLTGGSDRVSLVLGGGTTPEEATAALDAVRGTTATDAGDVVDAKLAWFEGLVGDAPMPATDDADVLAVARRAVTTLASVYDPGSGAIVASITTQSPYAEDWPRDGAFFNHALDVIGRSDWVATRNVWYSTLQADGDPTTGHPTQDAPVPPGNFGMNFYADGIVSGPIPWEIDETGYVLWTWWDHTAATGDLATLRTVYPAVVRAADFLTDCTDPVNGLQCTAIEDDNPQPRQSIDGAGPVLLGLEAAVEAAEALGETADAERWGARAEELQAAIDEQLYADGQYQRANGAIVWPACIHPFDDELLAPSHYDAMWEALQPTLAQPEAGPEGRTRGLYEVKRVISLAKATRGDPVWDERVRAALRWIATEHAEPDTHVMGEEWLLEDGEVVSTVAQPHVWEQILFYLAALEAHPPTGVDVEGVRDCDGVLGRLTAASDRDLGGAPAADSAEGTDGAASGGDGGGTDLAATGGGTAALATLVLVGAVAVMRRRRTA